MNARTGAAIGLLIALAIAAQASLHDRMLVPMDEGHLAAAADWMLDGKRLYRDIHTGIFPGIYLLTTGLFGVFGRDLLVTRIAAVAMNTVIAITLWLVARRMVGRHWAWLPPLLHLALVAVTFPVLSMFNYSTLAVCFGLLALLALLRLLEGGRTVDALLLGLLVALTTLTKQNFGALVFVALLAGLLWCRAGSAVAARPLGRTLIEIAVAGAVPTLLVVSYFAATGSLTDLLDSTVISLGGSQLQDFDNPIPPLFGPHPERDGRFIFLYSPPTVFASLVRGERWVGIEPTALFRSIATRVSYGLPLLAIATASLLVVFAPGEPVPERRRAVRASVLFAVVFFPGILPSAIFSHLAFVLIPVLLVFAYLADRFETALGARAGLVAGWRALIGVAMLGALVVVVAVSRDVVRWNAVPLDLPRATLRVSEREAGLFRGAVQFVDRCAGPGEPIFVAPDLPAVYFLTDRPNPTPYDLTIPGNVDGHLIVRRLEETRTRCIVYNPQMYPEFPPFHTLFPELHAYIQANFTAEEVIVGGDTRWGGLVRRSP